MATPGVKVHPKKGVFRHISMTVHWIYDVWCGSVELYLEYNCIILYNQKSKMAAPGVKVHLKKGVFRHISMTMH